MTAHVFPLRLPAHILADPRLKAERQIYEALKEQLPDDYAVFYRVGWILKDPDDRARDEETDFVIAHPQKGFLVLEVKGGAVRYHSELGQWFSGRNEIKDPFDEVRMSHYSLRRKAEESRTTRIYRYPSGYGVWFPDVKVPKIEIRPDAPREIILDVDSLTRVRRSIDALFQHWSTPETKGPGNAAIKAFTDLIQKSWEFRSPLSVEIRAETEHFDELTEQQFALLDFLASQRRALVCGCAGSGKTFLAAEKAKRLAQEGFDVLFTCYNRPLAEWLSPRLKPHGVSVAYFHQICQNFVTMARNKGAEIRIQEPGQDADANTRDRYYTYDMPTALDDALKVVESRYDAVIVDEGQDFEETWWIPLEGLLRDLGKGVLYIFYDDNQRIYQKKGSFPSDTSGPFHLTVNCRNTQAIHRLTARFYKASHPADCKGAIGRDPEVIVWRPGQDSPAKKLQQILHHLVNENYVQPEEIIVLTPIRKRSNWKEGLQVGNFELRWSLTPWRKSEFQPISVSTIHSFKGLERSVVVLTEIEQAHPNEREYLLYVGLSRARSHLIVLTANPSLLFQT